MAIRIYDSGQRWKLVGLYSVFFTIPGIIYFIWRWNYFGELLPLPFYVKSDTPRLFGIFAYGGALPALKHLAIVMPIILLTCGRQILTPSNLRLIIPLLAVPTAFYSMMQLEQNIGARFFYYMYISAMILIALNFRSIEARMRAWIPISILFGVICISTNYIGEVYNISSKRDKNIETIVKDLGMQPWSGRIAVTEAGKIPYYSGWEAYDLWGLNTAKFARHLVQPEDIVDLKPDVIVVHHPQDDQSCVSKDISNTPSDARSWQNMYNNVLAGILEVPHSYEVFILRLEDGPIHHRFLSIGSKDDYQCWFLRSDFTHYDHLAGLFNQHGAKSVGNFTEISRLDGSNGQDLNKNY